MHPLDQAIVSLEQALTSAPRLQTSWRHIVRQRVRGVDEALHRERTVANEPWLDARAGHISRERSRLIARLAALTSPASEHVSPEALRAELARLVHDLHHHRQRVNDLAWDSVALEVGGSE